MTHPAKLYVATLVCNREARCVSAELLAHAARAVGIKSTAAIRDLDPGIAADLLFELSAEAGLAGLVATLRSVVDPLPVDVIVQPLANRRKKLLVADMDSTFIGQECIDELADFVGRKAQVADITDRAMRGEIAFEPALRQRVALLRGLPAAVIAQVLAERITLTPGGPALVRTMRAAGAYTALISGGFTSFTQAVAAAIGFDENRANVLLIEDGVLAGRVREPILGRQAKLAALIELRDAYGHAAADTLAVGDGANDLAMLEAAGLGVAYRAKPAVAAAAHARIDHTDLSTLLYAQGYRRDEFVE